MTTRTTRATLDELAGIINRRLYLIPSEAVEIEYAYGSPRLVRKGRSVDVSPRLPAGELAQWMRAYIEGMDAGLWLDPVIPTGEYPRAR
jgi:hypothetical protein